VEPNISMTLNPAIVFRLGGVEVVQHHRDPHDRTGRDNALNKVQELARRRLLCGRLDESGGESPGPANRVVVRAVL